MPTDDGRPTQSETADVRLRIGRLVSLVARVQTAAARFQQLQEIDKATATWSKAYGVISLQLPLMDILREVAQFGLLGEYKTSDGQKHPCCPTPLMLSDSLEVLAESAARFRIGLSGGVPFTLTLIRDGIGQIDSPWCVGCAQGLSDAWPEKECMLFMKAGEHFLEDANKFIAALENRAIFSDPIELEQLAKLIFKSVGTIHNEMSKKRKSSDMDVPGIKMGGKYSYAEMRAFLLKVWPDAELRLPDSYAAAIELLSPTV